MTVNAKKELAILTVSALVAIPILGGVGLAVLGVVAW